MERVLRAITTRSRQSLHKMKDMVMVPSEDWQRLKLKYQNGVSQNALLDKVGTLGATEEVILGNPSIPSSMAVKIVQPLSRKRRNLTKRLKTGLTATTPSYNVSDDEPEAMVDTPGEALLKRLVKQRRVALPQTPQIKQQPPSTAKPGPSGLKKKKKKTVSTKKKTTLKKSVLKGAAKGVANTFGFSYSDSEDDEVSFLEGKAKKPKKGKKLKKKKTELDKLYLSDPPAPRGPLDYGSDEEGYPTTWEAY